MQSSISWLARKLKVLKLFTCIGVTWVVRLGWKPIQTEFKQLNLGHGPNLTNVVNQIISSNSNWVKLQSDLANKYDLYKHISIYKNIIFSHPSLFFTHA